MADELQWTAEDVPDAGQIVTMTLNRPERKNALNHAILTALLDGLDRAKRSRAVVLTGSDGNFCSGADLAGVEDAEFVGLLRRVLIAIRETPCPVIAAVDGFALGAGTQLSTACDLRVAAADATFGIPAAKLGLTVDWWTVRRVAAVCGESTARSMFVGSERLSGERAAALGYVHRIGGLDEAHAWARQLASLAPLTLAAHKKMLNRIEDDDATNLEVETVRSVAWQSDDLQEGLSAFKERRPAVFKGR